MGFLQRFFKSIKERSGSNKRENLAPAKKQMLDLFDSDDLKALCSHYDLEEPIFYGEEAVSTSASSTPTNREDLISALMDKLTLDQIKAFADQNKVNPSEISPEKKPGLSDEENENSLVLMGKGILSNRRPSEFDRLLKHIKENFKPSEVRHDVDLEKQLIQFLKVKYPTKIRRQVDIPNGKMDVVIDYRYALKLINAESKRKLKGLLGQVHTYKKAYKESAVILVNNGKMERPELLEIAGDYEKLGVRTLIFNVSFSWNQRDNQIE